MFEARRLGPGQSPESLAAASGTSIEPPGSVPAGPGGRSGASRASGLTALLWALRAGPALMLAAIVVAASLSTPLFMTTGNIGNVLDASAVIAVLAIGQLLVILTRGIDLSVGSTLALATVIGALVFQDGHGGPLVIGAMLATGLAVGDRERRGLRVRPRAASVHRHAGHAQHRARAGAPALGRPPEVRHAAVRHRHRGQVHRLVPALGVRRRRAGRGGRGAPRQDGLGALDLRGRRQPGGRTTYRHPLRGGPGLRVRAERAGGRARRRPHRGTTAPARPTSAISPSWTRSRP